MRRTAGTAVVLAVLLLASAAVAVPATAGNAALAGPGEAVLNDGNQTADGATVVPQTAQLELQQAFPGETDTDIASIEFTATSNETVTAPRERTDGEVTFEFDRWSGNGDDGTDNEFDVVAGETYEVEYEATGSSQGESGYDTTRSVYISRRGGMSGTLEANVEYVEPRFGGTDAGSTQEVRFEGTDEQTLSVTVEFRNSGAGDMDLQSTSASAGADITASTSSEPNRVDAGETETVTVDIAVDESIREGVHSIDLTLEDSLGNVETVRFDIEVVKATSVESDEPVVDLGNVLVGTSESVPVTIAEQTGYDSVDVSVSDPSGVNRNASASVSGLSGRLGAGDSRTGTATVSIDGDAAQHAEKTWTVQLDTDDPDAERKSFRIDARVIYPAMFGDSTGTGASYTFDERRGESTFTREVTTTVENTGDLPLAIEDVSVGSPTFDDDYVSADLTRASDSVPGLDSRDYNLDVTLDSEVPEGDHTLGVRFTSSNASAGTQTVEVPLTVEHETELDTDSERVEFGQLEISRTDTATVTVSEALGYNAIENLTLQRVDGPDQGWLTVQRDVPEQLAAGSESQTVFGLQFDTDAEVLTPYEWTYRVDGDDVEPRTITVTAEPGIIEGEETHERLQSFGDHPDLGESAGSMDEMLTRLEEKIEDGDLESGQDISRGFTAAQTFVEYLDAAERVQEVRESEGNEAAQDELVRSASTYNTVALYVSELEDPELRDLGQQALEEGNVVLDDEISTQRSYYEERIASEETSLLEEAMFKRSLARIAVLEGEDERATQLQAESDAAFEAYSANVSQGQASLQEARSARENLSGSMLTSVGGTPLLLNPANLGPFDKRSAHIEAQYDEAIAHFEAVGEQETADSIRAERGQRLSALSTARTAMFVVTAGYVLAFLALVLHLIRGTLAYVSDANEAVSGEFLV
ncbi:hypothetical protein [Haloarchaeobius sp. FL176]|uniref:hypothetical protein n=1 Tax=Haloarchaeobius sp. FL176 TaxID=2967129 RepID=UPI0021476203|nr:hypothetical protein [Haloarchaeobius sp. FL176]